MKKARKIILAIASLAFIIGATYFFVDGNTTAGVLGTVAATASVFAFFSQDKKSK